MPDENEDLRAGLLSLQRLEGEFSRHRSEFQRTRDDVLGLNGEIGNLKASVQGNIADLRTSINSLAAKLDEKSKTNWQAVAMVPAVIGFMWLFVTNYTSSEVSKATTPLIASTTANGKTVDQITGAMNAMQQSVASSSSENVASRTDRAQLNDRVRVIENELSKEIADRRSFAAEMIAKEIEIETQFCEQGHIINLMHANDMRNTAFLWHKVLGETYPTDNAYYPVVCHQGAGLGPIGNPG